MSSMDDDDLLAVLARSLPDARPPADAIAGAHAAFGWRTLDADLARLIDDHELEVVGFSDDTYARVLTYEADAGPTPGRLTVSVDGDRVRLDVSPHPTAVGLRIGDERRDLTISAEGRVAVGGLSGSVRFEVEWPDGSTRTPWMTL